MPRPVLLFVKLVGPHLGAMQHTQNTNPIRHHHIGSNVRRARDDKLACSGNFAKPTTFGKVKKATRSADDLLVHVGRRLRILAFNVTEDGVPIIKGYRAQTSLIGHPPRPYAGRPPDARESAHRRQHHRRPVGCPRAPATPSRGTRYRKPRYD